ncbi:hypothetical protein ANN_01957 [Periplaneta americana]|uniref:Transglutaminase-like domain-containing protein n=1 Tax=Periplaneta americana TaxID=6978 RepID=A0ABQ8TXZ6_PERAM|nr:hypothetical protein ANN_01957 [Periplaneta americana]
MKQKKIPQQPFLQRVRNDFAAVLRCEDKALQCKARALIPVRDLEIAAERSMRSLQKAVKSGQNKESDVDIQELVLLELLFWFKNSFFSWVDSPECSKCNGPTKFVGHRIIPDNGKQSYRNEVYVCELCQAQTLFPRYSDPEKLLETRRGRCGEWANCFMLMCRSLGWDTRCVVDETDHLWTEVYSGIRGRWLHCDPCENVCDAPLMYEAGWGKQLSYVMAYSRDEVQDVTWRYSSQHDRVLERRTACSEAELLATMMELRTARQRCLSAARRTHLTRRLLGELVEFLTPRQPTDNERKHYLQIRTTSSQFTVLLSQSLEFTVSRTTDLQRQFTVLELGSLQLRSTALELRSLQLRSTALELRPSDADADADAHSSRTPAGLLALAFSLTE